MSDFEFDSFVETTDFGEDLRRCVEVDENGGLTYYSPFVSFHGVVSMCRARYVSKRFGNPVLR
jgi:hypothetical protein